MPTDHRSPGTAGAGGGGRIGGEGERKRGAVKGHGRKGKVEGGGSEPIGPSARPRIRIP